MMEMIVTEGLSKRHEVLYAQLLFPPKVQAAAEFQPHWRDHLLQVHREWHRRCVPARSPDYTKRLAVPWSDREASWRRGCVRPFGPGLLPGTSHDRALSAR